MKTKSSKILRKLAGLMLGVMVLTTVTETEVMAADLSDFKSLTAGAAVALDAIDFMTNYAKYDEFGDAGMVYFDESPAHFLGNSTMDYIDFAYVYKKKDYKKFGVKNTYSGEDWLFIDKIQFLLDDGEILNLAVEPNRRVETFVRINTCKEVSVSMVSLEFINKILNSSKVKVKVNGDKGYFVFELSPIHKYQILTAKEYYDNYIIPEIQEE